MSLGFPLFRTFLFFDLRVVGGYVFLSLVPTTANVVEKDKKSVYYRS